MSIVVSSYIQHDEVRTKVKELTPKSSKGKKAFPTVFILLNETELKNETLRHWYAVGNVGSSARYPKMLLETWNFL